MGLPGVSKMTSPLVKLLVTSVKKPSFLLHGIHSSLFSKYRRQTDKGKVRYQTAFGQARAQTPMEITDRPVTMDRQKNREK